MNALSSRLPGWMAPPWIRDSDLSSPLREVYTPLDHLSTLSCPSGRFAAPGSHEGACPYQDCDSALGMRGNRGHYVLCTTRRIRREEKNRESRSPPSGWPDLDYPYDRLVPGRAAGQSGGPPPAVCFAAGARTPAGCLRRHAFPKNRGRGLLAWRFAPDTALVGWTGAIITAVGVAIAIAARFFLGKNWSGWVTVKKGHQLIRSGPYAVVRHPIYSGILFGVLGTAIVVGEVRGLIALAFAALGLRLKSLQEERFMEEEFGGEYRDYKRRVKAMIPLVW